MGLYGKTEYLGVLKLSLVLLQDSLDLTKITVEKNDMNGTLEVVDDSIDVGLNL